MAVGLSKMWEITDPAGAARRDAALLQGAAQPPRFPALASSGCIQVRDTVRAGNPVRVM